MRRGYSSTFAKTYVSSPFSWQDYSDCSRIIDKLLVFLLRSPRASPIDNLSQEAFIETSAMSTYSVEARCVDPTLSVFPLLFSLKRLQHQYDKLSKFA